MAIERQEPIEVNPNKPKTEVEQQFDEIINIENEPSPDGFTLLEDGSAVQGEEEELVDVSFDGNLAEVVDPEELMNVANDLIASIEKDKSSRKDW